MGLAFAARGIASGAQRSGHLTPQQTLLIFPKKIGAFW